MFSADDLELMRRVRRSVDPEELANRGKMLEPSPGGVVMEVGA